jgi:TP901 family phage tail tape measure protein
MANAIAKTTATIREAALESASYDKNGKLIEGTMRGIDSSGKAFTATLESIKGKLTTTKVKFDELNASANTTKNTFNDVGKAINEVFGMFQRFVGFKALNAMNDALKDGFNNARDFQVQISLIRTISQDSQLSFNAWADGIKKVSNESGLAIADVSKAAYDAVSNQVAKGNAVFPFLKDAADLAKTTGGTVADAGNLMASAMNTYGSAIGSTEELNALFFYTIDEGRVKMSDMANTFGRVGIIANGLGISTKELAGSIAFLTQKGVTTEDSFTFLKNIFIQFEKPSVQLQAFFKSIGVESGKAAFETYGWIGVLQKLKAEIAGGNLDIAKLFPEIRANIPIQGAIDDFKNFERIIDKAKDTKQLLTNFRNAKDIVNESPAAQLNKEFNELSNTFTVDIGQKLINLAKQLLQGFSEVSKIFTGDGSLSAGLNLAIVATRDLLIAFIAFRTASAATTAVVIAFNVAINAAGIGAVRTAAAVRAANIAMSASILGIIAAIAAVAVTSAVFGDNVIGHSNNFEEFNDRIKKVREEIVKTNALKLQPIGGDDFEKRSEKSFQFVLQGLAQFSIQTSQVLDALVEKGKASTKEFERSFETFTSTLKDNIGKTTKAITDNKAAVKEAEKELGNFQINANKALDAETLANLDPENKVKFIEDRKQALLSRASLKFATGNPAAVTEAERLEQTSVYSFDYDKNIAQAKALREAAKKPFDIENIKEADKLYSEVLAAEIEGIKATAAARKQAQQQYEAQNPYEHKMTDQEYKNETRPLIEAAEARLNNLYFLRLGLYKQLKAEKEKENIALQEQKKQEEENLKTVQDKFKAYNTFSVTNAGGGVKKEYQDKLSQKLDVSAGISGFDKVSDELLAAVRKSGTKEELIQVELLVAKIRMQKEQELVAYRNTENVKEAQQKVQATEKQLKMELEANKKQTDTLIKQQKDISILAASTEKSTIPRLTDPEATFGRSALQTIFGPIADPKTIMTPVVNAAKLQQEKYLQALKKLDTDKEQIPGQEPRFKIENIKNFDTTSSAFTATVSKALEEINGPNWRSKAVEGNEGVTYGELIDELKKLPTELKNNALSLLHTDEDRKRITQEYDTKLNPILSQFESLPGMAELRRANTRAADVTLQTADAMVSLAEAIKTLKERLTNFEPRNSTGIGKPYSVAPPEPTTGSTIAPGIDKPGNNAFGGWIGSQSSMIGADKYKVNAGDGEFMVNAESASLNADLLTQINKDRRGTNASVLGGNTSTSTVGDITIIVNEAKDGADTGRQVWNKIRREMRRGNITQGT